MSNTRRKRAKQQNRISSKRGRSKTLQTAGQQPVASTSPISATIEKDRRDGLQTTNAPIRHPVEIYQNGKWMQVERSSRKFPFAEVMTITPQWAIEVLQSRNTHNRKEKDNSINRYIDDMINGRWEVTNQGIGFLEDGSLADGQNRLWAVHDSKTPVDMMVTYGLKPEAMDAIDEGVMRSTRDLLHIKGIATPKNSSPAVAFILEQVGIKREMTRAQQVAFFTRHAAATAFVTSKVTRKGVARSPLLAVLIRAYYTIEHETLTRFMDILQTGQYLSKVENSAYRMREWMLSNSNNSGGFRLEMYERAQQSLMYFIEEKEMHRLTRSGVENFPLPEETAGHGLA
jgi:hypothetical protein